MKCNECIHYYACGNAGPYTDTSVCKQAYPKAEIDKLRDEVIAAENRKKEQPIRDELLITSAMRAVHMDYQGAINLPGGIEGEVQVSKSVVEIVDGYLRKDPDWEVNFDEYIEKALEEKFGDPLYKAYHILTKTQATGEPFDLDEVVGYLGQAMAD